MKEILSRYTKELGLILSDDQWHASVESLAKAIYDAWKDSNCIYICGNGGNWKHFLCGYGICLSDMILCSIVMGMLVMVYAWGYTLLSSSSIYAITHLLSHPTFFHIVVKTHGKYDWVKTWVRIYFGLSFVVKAIIVILSFLIASIDITWSMFGSLAVEFVFSVTFA